MKTWWIEYTNGTVKQFYAPNKGMLMWLITARKRPQTSRAIPPIIGDYMKIFGLLILSLLMQTGFAADFYVATTGSNSNPGTLEAPWRNIDYAVDNVSPGDTISVRGGTYNERVTWGVSGTAGNYITLQSYPGETVIMDGSGLGNGKMIYCNKMSYIKIIGLEITSYTGAGIQCRGPASHIEIRDNYLHDSFFEAADSWAIVIQAYNTDYAWAGSDPRFLTDAYITDVIIDGNTIFNVDTGVPTAFNEALTVAWGVKRFQITNNHIESVPFIGIDTIGGYSGIANAHPQYGYIAHNTLIDVGNDPDSLYPSSGIHCDGSTDIVVEHNIFRDNWYSGFDTSFEPTRQRIERFIVRHNKSLRNRTQGMYVGGFFDYAVNMRVSHNSIYQSSTWRPSTGLQVDLSNDVIIKNNVVRTPEWEGDYEGGPIRNYNIQIPVPVTNPELDYNLYWAPSPTTLWYWRNTFANNFTAFKTLSGQEANGIWGNPLYTNPTANDLTLQAGSPAIDVGTPLTTTDGAGIDSTTLVVEDSRWFHDGMGIEGLAGDTIRVGENTVVITDVNYNTNTITLATSISWNNGDDVSYPYNGIAPDMGAYETGGVAPGDIPNPPMLQ